MPNHKDETVVDTQRLTAPQIFHAAVENAEEELKRSARKLAFSGFAGGITLGLTALAVASVQGLLGDGPWQQFVSYLFYPIGFIAVIIGRAQLFTENTLYPVAKLVKLGSDAVVGSSASLFWSGVIGGWLIALVAWMVTASHWTIGQVAMIWLLTFIVGVGRFAHCIVTSGQILSAVLARAVPGPAYLHWLLFATMGNVVGGVVIVSLLNYGQVKEII